MQPGAATWVNGPTPVLRLPGRGRTQAVRSRARPAGRARAVEFRSISRPRWQVRSRRTCSSLDRADTELFVQLIDRAPDGTLLYLQRGMLRASHRQIDPAESQKTAGGRIYRPWRPHQERSLLTPRRGDRLPDRHIPGRPRVPAGPRAGGEGDAPPRTTTTTTTYRRRCRGPTRCTGAEHALEADAADHSDGQVRPRATRRAVPVRLDEVPARRLANRAAREDEPPTRKGPAPAGPFLRSHSPATAPPQFRLVFIRSGRLAGEFLSVRAKGGRFRLRMTVKKL